MTPHESAALERVLAELEASGLLLNADAALPSLTTLVAGEPIRGSWWGHPRGQAIFRVAQELADHPDAATVRLVSGKLTWVHRRLWPALVAVGSAGEVWQRRGLSPAARSLLTRVRKLGAVEASGAAARELERRLLVHAEQVHTESGAHAKRLASWEHWAKGVGLGRGRRTLERAKQEIEEAADALAKPSGSKAGLPWRPRRGA